MTAQAPLGCARQIVCGPLALQWATGRLVLLHVVRTKESARSSQQNMVTLDAYQAP